MNEYFWNPHETYEGNKPEYVLVILNTKIIDESRLVDVWNKARFKVTVDGGSNQWFQIVAKHSSRIPSPYPDLITGDLDSIDKEVLDYFAKKSRVCKTPDQNYTDFTKALFEVGKIESLSHCDIVAYAEHSGRLDQIFGIFETLYHVQDKSVFVVSSTSIEWLLLPGKHNIDLTSLQNSPDFARLHCGLIPLGQPCPGVKTTGFKWNLEGDTLLAFGHLVSTSNKFDPSVNLATVITSLPLLFTMEIKL